MSWSRAKKAVADEDRIIVDPVRARERTLKRAVMLLAAKPRAVAELRERLLEKAWTDAAIVDSVIEKLKGYNYLNDSEYARELASSQLRARPQGKRRLEQTLGRKKLDKTLIESAVAEAFEKLPESELIDAAIEKRIRIKGTPESRDALKKFYDHLFRQGFSYDLIRQKLSSLTNERLDESE